MRKTSFLLCLWLLIFGIYVRAEENKKTVQQPNILVILVDDLGYGDLSSYGAKDLQTPNIDSLMDAGVRFDQFYANCPV